MSNRPTPEELDPYHGQSDPFTNRYGVLECPTGQLRKDILLRRIAEAKVLGHSPAPERHEFVLMTETDHGIHGSGKNVFYRCTKCYARRDLPLKRREVTR
jgi:hypothetical protein